MFYFKIAIRNILRNYRRSTITIMAVVIGLAACTLAQGFINYSLWGLRESIINGGVGHFQLYKKGYTENGIDDQFNYMVSGYKKIIREDLATIEGIKVYAPRLNFVGMLSNGDKSIRVDGFGGREEDEKQLNSFSSLIAGTFLKEDNIPGVIIGSGVAKKLGAKPKTRLTLQVPMNGGGYNALDVEVAGIIQGQIKQYDDVFIMANLNFIQDAMNAPKSADKLIITLTNTDKLENIRPKIVEICKKYGLEYKDWSEIAGFEFEQPRNFYKMVFNIMMAIIVILVIFTITNTVQMNIFERIKEIGTIRALGTTRGQTIKIFVVEGFWIGVIGSIAGIALGVGVSAIIGAAGGISIPPPPGSSRGYQAFIKPDMILVLKHSVIFICTAIISAILPAKKASKLQITDALRWV